MKVVQIVMVVGVEKRGELVKVVSAIVNGSISEKLQTKRPRCLWCIV